MGAKHEGKEREVGILMLCCVQCTCVLGRVGFADLSLLPHTHTHGAVSTCNGCNSHLVSAGSSSNGTCATRAVETGGGRFA